MFDHRRKGGMLPSKMGRLFSLMLARPVFLAPLVATLVSAQTTKSKIAVFSGPSATIQNSAPLLTSNKARMKYGLPLLTNLEGTPLRFDGLRPQRLAAPVTVYIEAFSAHPLERDMSELYAPPDGYLNPATGVFSKQRQTSTDIPVYEVTLSPSDGLYLLPYMARRADGKAWDGNCTVSGVPPDPPSQCRLTFYPDASRIFEEIDRFGYANPGTNNLLSSKADFDFYRPAPSGGYRKGVPAKERTDVGEGDIPKETWGEDFFTYGSYETLQDPAMPTLARLTNIVQRALAKGEYAGAIWLEASPTAEETLYWLNLLINTMVPIVGNAAERSHGMIGNDGDRNILDSVNYILSDLWKDANGSDKVGAVMIQEEQIFAARDVQKGDDRPGGFLATGGHGGIIGSTSPLALTFLPTRKHTYSSEVNLARLPAVVSGVQQAGERIINVPVSIKDDTGELRSTAIPKVTIIKYARYTTETTADDPAAEVEILARIAKNLQDFPLSGFVVEGVAPYGFQNEQGELATKRAILRGMPVVRVGRGNHEGITPITPNDLFIEGSNLTSTKARLLLMACLLKFGSFPLPSNPDNPTKTELDAIQTKVAQYQEVFSTH